MMYRILTGSFSALLLVLPFSACATPAAGVAGTPPASITGTWKEVTPTPCQTEKGDIAAEPVRELKFGDDGKFGVTWRPFESYVDYWGTYTFDAATGAVAMSVTGGNNVPADARLTGMARANADGTIGFKGIFFGTPGGSGGIHTSACPLTFRH